MKKADCYISVNQLLNISPFCGLNAQNISEGGNQRQSVVSRAVISLP